MTPQRTRIGRASSLGTREVIYLTDTAVECDATDQFQVAQRRVLFEDAQLITLHRPPGTFVTAITGVMALLFLIGGAWLYTLGSTIGGSTLLVIGALLGVTAVFRTIVKPSVITIFGKRSMIVIRFLLKQERAREQYEILRTAIRVAQERQRPRVVETEAPFDEIPPPTDVPPS